MLQLGVKEILRNLRRRYSRSIEKEWSKSDIFKISMKFKVNTNLVLTLVLKLNINSKASLEGKNVACTCSFKLC